MIRLPEIAPISDAALAGLRTDANNVKDAAKRKGSTLDRGEEERESRTAMNHFELGCWLYRYTTLRGLTPAQDLEERVNLLVRLFLAGIYNPTYDFFTVFDFGERQFDGIFENGDSQAVLNALREKLPQDTTGQLAKAFEYYSWPTAVASSETT